MGGSYIPYLNVYKALYMLFNQKTILQYSLIMIEHRGQIGGMRRIWPRDPFLLI